MADSKKVLEIIRAIGLKMEAEKEYLTELDQPIGDKMCIRDSLEADQGQSTCNRLFQRITHHAVQHQYIRVG